MFRWQKLWVIIILFLNVGSLILLTVSPTGGDITLVLMLYVNIFYFALGTSAITGVGNSNHPMQQAFSGKYLLALPCSKEKLVLSILVAGSFTTIPLVASVIFIKVFRPINTKTIDGASKYLITLVEGYPLSLLVLILSMYAIFLLLNIKTMVVVSVLITIFTYSATTSKYYIVALVACVMVLYQYFDTMKAIHDERVSYWRWKYNTAELIILIIIPTALLFSFFADYALNLDRGSAAMFTSGGKYFSMLKRNECEDVMNAPNLYEELKKYNKYGISLAHTASMHTLDRDYKFADEFIKHIDLLSLPIKTTSKSRDNGYSYVNGTTPLHLMSMISSNDEVISKVAEVYPEGLLVKNERGMTPLHFAAINCNYRVIEKIKDKVNVNVQDERGYTPLMHAASNKCWLSSLILLNSGADYNLLNRDSRKAIDLTSDFRLKFLFDRLDGEK